MKKRLNLEELSLELPKIEINETRFLLGGDDYADSPNNCNCPQGAESVDTSNSSSGNNSNNSGPIDPNYDENYDPDNYDNQDYDTAENDQDQDDNEQDNEEGENSVVDLDQANEWGISEFFEHYNNGNGDPVTLNEIGLRDDLRRSDVYEQLMNNVRDQIKAHVEQQIALGSNYAGTFQQIWDFNNSYDFTFTEDMFAIGSATLSGHFTGDLVVANDGSWTLEGSILINFLDIFDDPWDIINAFPGSWNPTGTPYNITDFWTEQISINP